MKILFFCSNRIGAINALRYMSTCEIELIGCVCEEAFPNMISNFCHEKNIHFYRISDIYKMINNKCLPEIDYGISYLYSRIIKESIIQQLNGKIINFHPAPIQEHKGIAACCFCLLHGYTDWAVTAHYLTKEVDQGDIILQRWFTVGNILTSIELEAKEQKESLLLLQDVCSLLLSGKELPREKQNPESGNYYSKIDLQHDKEITLNDTSIEIDKKIMALWFPPFHGASIVIDGKQYTLVNDELLKKIACIYQKANMM
ncbi:MAG: formyltransferase family protein [Clostridia bacterium]